MFVDGGGGSIYGKEASESGGSNFILSLWSHRQFHRHLLLLNRVPRALLTLKITRFVKTSFIEKLNAGPSEGIIVFPLYIVLLFIIFYYGTISV